jgi:hypothetical protein
LRDAILPPALPDDPNTEYCAVQRRRASAWRVPDVMNWHDGVKGVHLAATLRGRPWRDGTSLGALAKTSRRGKALLGRSSLTEFGSYFLQEDVQQ